MNNYKQLTTKEKNDIFEDVWEDYSKNKILNKLNIYIAVAAMIIFSIVGVSSLNNNFSTNINAISYSDVTNYDLYEDEKEGIFTESLRDMSKEDLDNILTQL